ncbi:succinate dehydrogenase cytochrome b subunit [Xanthovirga aplysinae]|uniref:succinate dehydrogenase cytochrome b subunit n=1 Tax=Xanthovirga aplysinae TaxID=2529853 RepID=UPI0012BB896C|nr:succinate dehydrogenase cytochrome b subunit [Xanthovirga aplysinae]MTI32046.1 succinate dehydrogenase cytochrome b subunit [Xanthovirga aplysinae]
MSWFNQTFSSTLGKKLIMSATGLFLILFLIGHVAGNLQIFFAEADNGRLFNEYALFMTTNPAVKVLSYLTYISILGHVFYSIALTQRNKKARPVGYSVENASANSAWTSRNMGVLGTFVLIFLVIHLKSFWYEMHWGGIPVQNYDGQEVKDLYVIVKAAFSQLWYVGLYVFCMILLAFHLSHGFQSAFQTLGLNHKKYTPLIKKVGMAFAIIVPLLFALMPIYVYIQSLG